MQPLPLPRPRYYTWYQQLSTFAAAPRGPRGAGVFVPPPQQSHAGFAPPPQQSHAAFAPPPQQSHAAFAPPPQQSHAAFAPPLQQSNAPIIAPRITPAFNRLRQSTAEVPEQADDQADGLADGLADEEHIPEQVVYFSEDAAEQDPEALPEQVVFFDEAGETFNEDPMGYNVQEEVPPQEFQFQRVKEEPSELPASLRQGLPRIVEPNLRESKPMRTDDLKQLTAWEVERGMLVVYDGYRRAWVDNCFHEDDQFWLCDEQTNKVIFNQGEDSIRAFRSSELLFTGNYTPLVMISTEVIITQEILDRLSQQQDWEGQMEEKTGIEIRIDPPRFKVVIGEGPPLEVKRALQVVNAEIARLDQQIWSADQQVESPPPPAPPAPPEPASAEELTSQLASPVPEAPHGGTPKKSDARIRPLDEDEEDEVARRVKRKLMADSQEMFRLGFQAALRQMEEAKAERGAAETSVPVKDERGAPPAEFANILREKVSAASATSAEKPQQANGAAPVSAPAVAPAAAEPAASRPNNEVKTVMQWAQDQGQFSHLTPLPPDWIRVRRKTGNGIYFVNIRSGRAQFDLPDGWVKMKSRSSGAPYYWNPKTGVSQLEKPPDAVADQPAQSVITGAATPAPAATGAHD